MAQQGSVEDFLAKAVDAAKSAGEIIRSGFHETKRVEHKGRFIGEETTAANGAFELTDEPTWIVDPVDGTTNFVHGKLFTAIRGKGAFFNGKSIKVSSQNELVKSLLATEVGATRDEATLDAVTNSINRLVLQVRSLRMCGSTALDLCGIACGRLDLFYQKGFGPWDVAAGCVIVNEAGGVVCDPSGKKNVDITSQQIAASNPLVKDSFIEALQWQQ